jgi:hypothetical protein
MGKIQMTLQELYPYADESDDYFGLSVKLKKLCDEKYAK